MPAFRLCQIRLVNFLAQLPSVFVEASISVSLFVLTETPVTHVLNFTVPIDEDIAAFILNAGATTGTVYVDNVQLIARQ